MGDYVLGSYGGHGIETMGEEILGDDWGQGFQTVGAAPAWQAAFNNANAQAYGAAKPHQFRMPALKGQAAMPGAVLQLPPRPEWRPQLAPGVAMPGEGLEPLPMTPIQNGGVFTPAVGTITWQSRPQAPFRGERLLASVRRSAGAAGVSILSSGVFVGRQLQQLELGEFDVEFFAATAFGVRLQFVSAEPGMLIQLQARGSIAVPANESVSVSFMILGRTIR